MKGHDAEILSCTTEYVVTCQNIILVMQPESALFPALRTFSRYLVPHRGLQAGQHVCSVATVLVCDIGPIWTLFAPVSDSVLEECNASAP